MFQKLSGILRIFTLPENVDIIITDMEGDENLISRFSKDNTIELRNDYEEKLTLTIKSAELATNQGKTYLAFVLTEKVNQQAIKAFDQIWVYISKQSKQL